MNAVGDLQAKLLPEFTAWWKKSDRWESLQLDDKALGIRQQAAEAFNEFDRCSSAPCCMDQLVVCSQQEVWQHLYRRFRQILQVAGGEEGSLAVDMACSDSMRCSSRRKRKRRAWLIWTRTATKRFSACSAWCALLQGCPFCRFNEYVEASWLAADTGD